MAGQDRGELEEEEKMGGGRWEGVDEGEEVLERKGGNEQRIPGFQNRCLHMYLGVMSIGPVGGRGLCTFGIFFSELRQKNSGRKKEEKQEIYLLEMGPVLLCWLL